MDRLQSHIAPQQKELIAFLRELVECESPSDDPAAVNRFVDLFAERVKDIAKIRTNKANGFGRHLLCEFTLPGPKRKPPEQLLALGHSDTVWPIGTLRTMPCRIHQGRLWGPGVFDMKAGLALFVFAMRALRDVDLPVARKVVLQINSDEEVGSPTSRPFTEEQASKSAAVLVLEPAMGLDGKLKTSRKGVGDYAVRVKGISAHAGLDFEKGASAILEIARQIERIATFTDLKRGITVNPGVIHGGTRSNVTAAEAEVEVDVRLPRTSDFPGIRRKFQSLRPHDKRCKVEIEGGLNRPPFERTAGTVRLLRLAQKLGAELGLDIGESSAGGGSDGNFTSALGIPTLDGLGAVGDGAHAPHESVLIDSLVPRAALLAKMVESL